MKKCKRISMFFVITALLAALWSVAAYADAADYNTYNYQNEKETIIVAAKDGSGYLYLRYGPGTEYDILCEIYDGTVLEVNGTSGDAKGEARWGHVKYNNMWGGSP